MTSRSPAVDRSQEVQHDEAGNRFVLTSDGETAFLSYARKHDGLALLHTEVPPELEGEGIGSALVRAAVEYARGQGLRVMPVCPFARVWLERHPEYKSDVAPG